MKRDGACPTPRSSVAGDRHDPGPGRHQRTCHDPLSRPVVVLDACVLVPYPLVTALLTMAEKELFEPRWSERILAEVERTLTGKLGIDPGKAEHRLTHMRAGFPESSVHGFEELVSEMTRPGREELRRGVAARRGPTSSQPADEHRGAARPSRAPRPDLRQHRPPVDSGRGRPLGGRSSARGRRPRVLTSTPGAHGP